MAIFKLIAPFAAKPVAALAVSVLKLRGPYKFARCKLICCKCPYTCCGIFMVSKKWPLSRVETVIYPIKKALDRILDSFIKSINDMKSKKETIKRRIDYFFFFLSVFVTIFYITGMQLAMISQYPERPVDTKQDARKT